MADIDYAQFTDKMKKTTEVLGTQFDSVRAGRANAAVLDQIRVDYYGTPTPINQIAAVAVAEARILGYQRCYLETTEVLREATSLYESLGFEHLPGPLGCTGHDACEICMVLEL